MDKNVELEKSSKKRSSILKTPKNNVEEVDMLEPIEDETVVFSKSVRRVSFASSNFVKPFVADPDKNTIWDTTYEEAINHTDSTHSSQEHTNTCSKFSSTLKTLSNITNISISEMELTAAAVIEDKDPLVPPQRISIINYAKSLREGLVAPLYNLPSHNETCVQTQKMELTCQNLISPITSSDPEVDMSEMDLTDVFVEDTERHENAILNKSVGNDMEFTCQMPKLNPLYVPDKSKNVSIMSKTAIDMEFTCQIPASNIGPLSGNSKNSNELSNTVSDMEFTCQIPNLKIEPVPDNSKNSKKLTNTVNGMELTCQLPKLNLGQVSDKSGCQNVSVMSKIATVTDQIPTSKIESHSASCKNSDLISTATDMEFTCQIPVSKTGSLFDNSKNSNTLSKSASDMEVTCHVPSPKIVTNSKSILSNTASDMEFTCQIPISKTEPLPRNSKISNKLSNTINDMEFTCQVSKLNLEQFCDKSICENVNVMSKSATVTDQIPTKSKSPSILSKTANDLELACRTPLSETVMNVQNSNTHSKTEIEFTCQIPVNDQVSKTEELVAGYMDDTCRIPRTSRIGTFLTGDIEKENIDMNKTRQITKNTDSVYQTSHNDIEMNQQKLSETEYMEISYGLPKEASNDSNLSVIEESEFQVSTKNCSPIKVFKDCEEAKMNTSAAASCSQINPRSPIIYNPKIENVGLAEPSFVYFKTPEPSFHISNISSEADDTQKLIHCTYTKTIPESFLASKVIPENYNSLNLEEEEEGLVSKPNLSNTTLHENDGDYVIRNISQSSSDISYVDPQRNKLATVNDTYVLKGITFTRNNTEDSNLEGDDRKETSDTSLGYLEIEKMPLEDYSETGLHELTSHKKNVQPSDFKLKEYDFSIKKLKFRSDVFEKIATQRAEIKYFLENFKFDPIPIPKKFIITETSPIEIPLDSEEKKTNNENGPSLEEKVKNHQKSCLNSWELVKIDGDHYRFSTLFGTLVFVVHVNPLNGTVDSIETKNNLADYVDSVAHYIMKLFLDKLCTHQIKCALGEHYDLLSLLDYVQMLLTKLIEVNDELMKFNFLNMDKNFLATFTILDENLLLCFDIIIDVSDLDNIDYETITIREEMGHVDRIEIINCIKNCSKGFLFFKEFLGSIENYFTLIKQRKRFKKSYI